MTAATAKDKPYSDHKTITSGEKEIEDDENSDMKKRDKATAEWIGRPFKLPLRNENEEDEDEEEDVGAPLASIEDAPPGDEDDEGCEYHR